MHPGGVGCYSANHKNIQICTRPQVPRLVPTTGKLSEHLTMCRAERHSLLTPVQTHAPPAASLPSMTGPGVEEPGFSVVSCLKL